MTEDEMAGWHKELDMTEQLIGEGDGTPLQYTCLENPMDRGAPSSKRLSQMQPLDLERSAASAPAWSGRGSRPSRRTSG